MSLRDLIDAAYAAMVEDFRSAGLTISEAVARVDGWLRDVEARAAAAQGDRSLLQQQNADAMQQLMAMVAGTQSGGSPA